MKEIGIKKRVSFIGAGQLFNALTNVLLVPYLARAMSSESYGTYGQVLMVCGIFQVIFSFGFSKLIYNQLNTFNERKSEAVLNTFIGALILALIGSFILFSTSFYIASFLNNPQLAFYLKLFAFSILFGLLSQIITSILNHFNRVKEISLITIINNLLRVLIIFLAIQIFQSLALVFWGLLLLSILQFIALWWISPISLIKGKVDFYLVGKIVKSGLPLGLSGVTTLLIVQTDGLMISKMLDTASYAIYRMGAITIPFLFVIYSSVITITMPEVTKMFHNEKIKELLNFKRKASLSVAALVYPILIFMLIFSEDIIRIYLGKQYEGSRLVFVIYNLLLFLRINDYRDILIVGGNTSSLFYADLIVFFLNIGLNYILIKSLGIEGAAIASIASFYLLSFTLLYLTKLKLKVGIGAFFNFKKLFQLILISSTIGLICIIIHSYLKATWWLIPIAFFYFVTTYLIVIRFKVIPKKQIEEILERSRLLKPFNNILKYI